MGTWASIAENIHMNFYKFFVMCFGSSKHSTYKNIDSGYKILRDSFVDLELDGRIIVNGS